MNDRLLKINECKEDCFRMMIQASSEHEIITKIPEILVNKGGYRFSWIGYITRDQDKSITPMSQTGFEHGYLSSIKISWDDSQYGQGPTGNCIRSAKPDRIQNILKDPRFKPWRAAALERGYESSAAFPILQNDEVMGALNIYCGEPFGFADDEMETLADLVKHLSHVISNFRIREEEKLVGLVYQMIFDEAPDGLFVSDLGGNFLKVNAKSCEILGFDEQDILQMKYHDLIVDKKHQHIYMDILEGKSIKRQRILLRSDNRKIRVSLTARQLSDGNVLTMMRLLNPVDTTRKFLRKRFHIDAHTGFPNRQYFEEQLHLILKKQNVQIHVILINLDHFRRISNAIGRERSTNILKIIGNRIQNALADIKDFAYAGFNEFYLIMRGLSDDECAKQMRMILDYIAMPIVDNQESFIITACAGIVANTDQDQNVNDLIGKAYTAYSWARRTGSDKYRWFSSQMESEALENMQLESLITEAILHDHFEIYYQEQIDTRSQSVVGYEALIRLMKDGQIISPIKFIPIAEQSGLIHGIGAWLIHNLTYTIRQLKKMGCLVPEISLNISPVQFLEDDLPEKIFRAIEINDVKPEEICLEITESSLIMDPAHAIRMLNSFHDYNFRIAIDDFGTGFSSLGSIRDYPFDVLKIDKSFIRNIGRSNKDNAIVNTVIQLAKNMEIEVIAEGVETNEQREYLESKDCFLMQGFLFHRPAPVDEINFAEV